jgi:hypothetical protein
VLVPEQLFVEHKGNWWFHQTSFFGPPFMGFNVEPGLHLAVFNVDVGEPRTAEPTRAAITLRSDELVRRYGDGAHLYRCKVEAPGTWLDHPSGTARPLKDGDFALELFHITNPAAAKAIKKSGEIRSSSWNLQGTRRLANVGYVYLTSLPQIRDEGDLRRIAMASDGLIWFQTTSDRPRENALRLQVYRENTTGRTASLRVTVPSSLIAPPHLLLHRTAEEGYYEVIGPEIYRIGLQPTASLQYAGGEGFAAPASLKNFTYIVVGDAALLEGLAAPYDEEDTRQVMHLEALEGTDPFEFWLAHANSDQMTGRVFEPRELD